MNSKRELYDQRIVLSAVRSPEPVPDCASMAAVAVAVLCKLCLPARKCLSTAQRLTLKSISRYTASYCNVFSLSIFFTLIYAGDPAA